MRICVSAPISVHLRGMGLGVGGGGGGMMMDPFQSGRLGGVPDFRG